MAVTGQFMIIYVIAHVIGNYTIFAAPSMPMPKGSGTGLTPSCSGRRARSCSVLLLHTYYGIILKLENRKAKPETYAVKQYRTRRLPDRTMIWSGVVIALFLIYHLLHFTFQVIDPSLAAISASGCPGPAGCLHHGCRKLSSGGIASLYVIGVLAPGLHLYHGIESSIQTEGLNNDRTLPVVVKIGIDRGGTPVPRICGDTGNDIIRM